MLYSPCICKILPFGPSLTNLFKKLANFSFEVSFFILSNIPENKSLANSVNLGSLSKINIKVLGTIQIL